MEKNDIYGLEEVVSSGRLSWRAFFDGPKYELSSKGDIRFYDRVARFDEGTMLGNVDISFMDIHSVFNYLLVDVKDTLPEHKGAMYDAYYSLWCLWARQNPDLLKSLANNIQGLLEKNEQLMLTCTNGYKNVQNSARVFVDYYSGKRISVEDSINLDKLRPLHGLRRSVAKGEMPASFGGHSLRDELNTGQEARWKMIFPEGYLIDMDVDGETRTVDVSGLTVDDVYVKYLKKTGENGKDREGMGALPGYGSPLYLSKDLYSKLNEKGRRRYYFEAGYKPLVYLWSETENCFSEDGLAKVCKYDRGYLDRDGRSPAIAVRHLLEGRPLHDLAIVKAHGPDLSLRQNKI